jgi:DNA-binding transcriptional LysR family regulator
MKNINLRQLEAFRAVMQTKSITRAAETLFVSQPAVSRLIIDLERTVDFPLFNRVKKRLVPTPEAQALYEEVERSFTGLSKISLAAREIREFSSGSLSIAALPALGLSYLPEMISQFATERPDVSLSLMIRGSQNVSGLVASQRVDVGFAESIDFDDGIDAELLLTTEQVCIMPTQHRLAEREIVNAADLDGEPFVGSVNWQRPWKNLGYLFEEHQVRRKVQIETQLNATVAEFVLSGAGLGIIDPITADRYVSRGLVIKPFIPAVHYSYYVLFPENRPRSRLAEQFVENIRKNLARYASALESS